MGRRTTQTARQKGAEEQNIHDGAETAYEEVTQELDRVRRVRHIVAHNAIEGAESILRTNLLALLIRPACVGDAHLIIRSRSRAI